MSKNERQKRFYRSEKERESYIIRYNEKNISLNIIKKNNHNACITNFEKEHYKQDRVNLEDD